MCCTLEFLHSKGLGTGVKDSDILGYRDSDHGRWMYWNKNGKADEDDWNIKEIIPVQQEVKQDVTEVIPAQGDNTALRALRANKSPCDVGAVFQEKTYTLEQIKEAFGVLQWYDNSFELLSDKLNESQDPEYKLYLELKAKFEGKE